MKKLLLTLFVGVFCLVVVGCTPKKAADPENNTPPANDTTRQPGQQDAEKPETAMVESGDVVRVDYVGTTEDGEVFDTSLESVAQEEGLYNELRSYEPLEFTVGQGQMIPGFEKGVLGMKVNEKKTITIPPEEAYGEINEELVQTVPASNFDEAGIVPEVGQTYNFGVAQGTILSIEEDSVTIDFNHPLAGKTLTFDVTLKEIISSDIVQGGEEAVDENDNSETN